MQPGDRQSVLDWVRARPERPIRLRMRGSSVVVTGVCKTLTELDACSTEFDEGRIAVPVAGVEISLTFHEETLGLHVLVQADGAARALVSIPVSIPYEAVILEDVDVAEDSRTSSAPGGRIQRTPYQLLHSDS